MIYQSDVPNGTFLLGTLFFYQPLIPNGIF
ncbi:hypothetical protein HNP37_000395 [Flavobacterium nitrogenifigens]|uniref:Uncharacterized protein n=2 Tax=Flavobacterium TaxID=237 RepID=A0A7W7N6E6_9FLAO|nr:hypothetical protein [Flavobacterium nitrogenifigens]MBB6385894.1 hypothetical protein [Flavobacterium notoginsengisoli]